MDFATAKQRMNSSVGMQVQMMNDLKNAKDDSQRKTEELEAVKKELEQY